MCATEQHTVFIFRAMPQYAATAMVACGCQGVYRAFKTVKGVCLSSQGHLESLVIIISANFTNRQAFT